MTKRALSILITTVVVVGFVVVLIASSVGGDSSSAMHVMPGGQTMTGESMSGREAMPSTNHQMDDGSMMDGGGGR